MRFEYFVPHLEFNAADDSLTYELLKDDLPLKRSLQDLDTNKVFFPAARLAQRSRNRRALSARSRASELATEECCQRQKSHKLSKLCHAVYIYIYTLVYTDFYTLSLNMVEIGRAHV